MDIKTVPPFVVCLFVVCCPSNCCLFVCLLSLHLSIFINLWYSECPAPEDVEMTDDLQHHLLVLNISRDIWTKAGWISRDIFWAKILKLDVLATLSFEWLEVRWRIVLFNILKTNARYFEAKILDRDNHAQDSRLNCRKSLASRNAEASHTGLCHTSNNQDNEDRADDKYRGLLEKNGF